MSRTAASNPTITRYLLGELPEAEQAAFEEAYFRDARLSDEVAEAESALVDDFVRGRLPEALRQRFEAYYLADPRRRERVKFAEALIDIADREEGPALEPHDPGARHSSSSWWRPFIGAQPAWAVAAVILIVAAAGLWLYTRTEPARQQDPDAETARSQQPSGGATATTPPDGIVASSTVVTLTIVIAPGTRSPTAKPEATLALSPAAAELRLQITVREPDYQAYRAVLRKIGGIEVAQRGDLDAPKDRSDLVFTLTVAAAGLEPGDYMLTLGGRTGTGDFEDVSQSIIRINRQ